MRSIAILILGFLSFNVLAQKFINGDFENTTATIDQINLSNEALNNMLPGVTAFGSYGDVDIINSSTYGGSGAKSNKWYIALTGGKTDIVSLELTGNLVKGKTYSISFFDRKSSGYEASAMQIGLSDSNNDFGTIIYTSDKSPELNVWNKRVFSFVAPNNGKYITVQMPEGSISNWVNIDGFNFENTNQKNCLVCDTMLTVIASSHKIKKGLSVSLTASGGYKYTWSSNNKNILDTGNVITFIPQSSATYTVVSKRPGCPDIEATVFIEVYVPKELIDTVPEIEPIVPKYIKFTKRHLNGRRYKVQQTITSDHKTVKVSIYDKNRVDGDIVSIYLNGMLIVENFQVTHQKKEFNLELKEGSNVLVMYAINLGRIPPNTAALEINNGEKRKKITTLVSDFKNSGALELLYNDNALSMR